MNSIESSRRMKSQSLALWPRYLWSRWLAWARATRHPRPTLRAQRKAAGMTIGTENIAVVTLGEVTSGPTLSGDLMPEREATVRAQVGGSVLQTYAEQGQRVSAGQLLAQVDASGLQDAFLSARAGVTSAKNNADVANRELARSEKLLAAGAIAERDMEQSRRASIAANAALADARARLANAQKQVGNTRIVRADSPES